MTKSIRSLIKSAPYSLGVILTLTVGIGATGALFTVVNSLLIKPLPYENSSELALLSALNQDASGKLNQYTTSTTNLLDWRERGRAFQSIAGMQVDEMAITGKQRPLEVEVGRTTANLFDTLGVQPLRGRYFKTAEETDSHFVAILSYSFWRDSFGSSENLGALKLYLNNVSYEIVGVTPPEFFFVTPVHLYIPLNTSVPRTPRTNSGFVQPVARIKQGVSLESANADIQRVASELAKESPSTHTGWSAKAHDIRGTLIQNFRPVLIVLTAGVFLLLLISCTNAANLVLARAISLQNEIAIRLALGAGRMHLFVQIFTEHLLLTCTSGALGFILTIASVRPIVMLSPLSVALGRSFRLTDSMAIDWRVPILILALSIVLSMIFSLLPVFRFTKPNLAQTLRLEGRTTASKKRSRLRDLMVVSEIAMACILLTAAGWIVQRFWSLNRIDPGFETSQGIIFKIVLPANYDTHQKRALFLQQARKRLAAVPGFLTVGASSRSPISEFVFTTLFNIEGHPPAHPGEALVCNFKRVSSEYFKTSGVTILSGREFKDSDAGSMPVAIVSREFEKRYWPGQSAIGKRIIRQSRTDNVYRTIIGVVEDVKDTTVWEKANPALYVPYEQGSIPNLFFIIRTGVDISAARTMIESAIWSMDPNLPITDLKTMKDLFNESLSRPRFAAYLITIFAFLGIFLAAIGVYGSVSYSIHQRQKEIGIRLAMGSYPAQIQKFLLGQGFRVAILGLLCGLLGTLLLAQLTNRLDYAGDASLLPAFVFAVGSTLFIWGVASSVPASRASKLDPALVLK